MAKTIYLDIERPLNRRPGGYRLVRTRAGFRLVRSRADPVIKDAPSPEAAAAMSKETAE